MPSVQIKDVPRDVHTVLRERAARANQSLQEYLLTKLTDEARTPTLEEVFDRIERRGGAATFTLADSGAAVRAERESH